MLYKWPNLRFFLVVLIIGLSSISCEDPLPSYEEPKEVFKIDFFPDTPSVITYRGRDSNVPDEMPYSISPNMMYMRVRVTNVYDDVLQGPLFISGEVSLTFVKDERVRIVVPFTQANALSSPYVDWSTMTLTLEPGQPIWLQPTWDWKQDKKWIFRYTAFATIPVGGNSYMKDHEPMEFKGKVRVQIFRQKGPVYSEEKEFSLKFQGILNLGP